MNKKYSEHFLMKIEDAKVYAKEQLHFFDDNAVLDACEIGDGNINYVFKVWDTATGRSVIIKQADKVLRASGRPLDLHRNKIEAEILKIQRELAPKYVPEIYYYDENMFALSMEDISVYKNLRTEMMAGKVFGHLAENISEFMVETLLPTTDLVLNRAEKKNRVKLFTNIELCDISEDLVFTEPYYDYKGRNIVLEENLEYVKEHLYNNEELKAQVGILRNAFMNNAQALVHGDLHSGSIFANQDGIKVIDPEFAFYGPMGYDIGNVIGNTFFAWANKEFTQPENKEFIGWVEKTIADTFDLFEKKFSEKYDELVEFELYNNKYFKENYIKEIMADTLGYAGTEIIRRVVCDSKVAEITKVDDLTKRVPMERALIQLGTSLIMNRYSLTSGKQVTDEFKKILEVR